MMGEARRITGPMSMGHATASMMAERMTHGRQLRGLTMLAGLVLAAPASATVLEIAPDGAVTVYDRPALYRNGDARQAPNVQPLLASPAVPRSRPVTWTVPRRSAPAGVMAAIQSAAITQQLDPTLIQAVAWRESRLRSDAVSPKGARGVMQLMPETARGLGVNADQMDENVQGGTRYLKQLMARYNGDVIKALAAYNAGPGAVDRHGGPPPYRETQAYVDAVMEHLAESVVPNPANLSTRTRTKP